MPRTIQIDPITRIEGHARVEVDIDDNNEVTSTVFKVMDFRGWETFLRGTRVEMMPSITPRICGTCSVSHHLASAKAVDSVFGVTPPRPAVLLRQALNLGGYLHSHSVHIFALAGPDLLLGLDADPAKRNIMGLIEANPAVAKKALELRAISTRIMEAIGGRGIHPVSAVAGGMAAPLDEEKRDQLRRQAEKGLALTTELFHAVKDGLIENVDLVESLPLPTHYLGLVDDGMLNFYQGELCSTAPDGEKFTFAEEDWTSHLVEETTPASYAKFVLCRKDENDPGVPYRVGPLARINCCEAIDTPLANAELQEFRKTAGFPTHQTVFYHVARLFELLHAAEKLVQLLDEDDICATDVRVIPDKKPGHGAGILEAPRGVLIHDYRVNEEGVVEDLNLIVATQQNIPGINATVDLSVRKYLEKPDELLLNGIEFGIRCYDPCLSCATHRLGEMKLEVVVRHGQEIIRTAKRV
ncbi:MAG: F420-non-reducing hydrogenase large subunit [Candidatus Kentron sp. G]|nr:MAG: F420-non-reducing hydrogenase large subunit [Candidatus Kentron sp. G]VFN02001.1 MAG: F420-non-reducing hydrogenase large subunit [Candidatus Kentron sp. G]VFN03555.1 MAG: F420-non-reducing hydrogenase large subunit [Candidatus Kentron sp. G]